MKYEVKEVGEGDKRAKDGGDIEMEGEGGSDWGRAGGAGSEKHPSTDHEYLGSRGI